jgi:hypothetical protein
MIKNDKEVTRLGFGKIKIYKLLLFELSHKSNYKPSQLQLKFNSFNYKIKLVPIKLI